MTSEPWAGESLRYVRTNSGGTIHRATCKRRGSTGGVPWNWADDMTPRQILDILDERHLDYHWCRFCFPMDERVETFGFDFEGVPQ